MPIRGDLSYGAGVKQLLRSLLIVLTWVPSDFADNPQLNGGPAHEAFQFSAKIGPPFHLEWVRTFPDERLGTAMEPIVANGKVFVATQTGSVQAMDSATGKLIWQFRAEGSFLQSPAVAGGLALAACTDGFLYALDPQNGNLVWSFFAARGGFAAAPIVWNGLVFIGDRVGNFFGIELDTGNLRWHQTVGIPIRQTAAAEAGRVYVTAEDLRLRCFDAESGRLRWVSEPFNGQTARDYYPVIAKSGNRTFVIVRTNPVLSMGNQIARDRRFLCQNAGVDDSDWRKLEAWTRSAQSRGTPALWEKEQRAIVDYLKTHRDARTFFVIDGDTGREAFVPPVLWAAGCEGVGFPPARTPEGKWLVFYRSVYGNWNLGVAPLVALGLLDLRENKIEPLFHESGAQPPWNTFWGTADESQHFVVASDTLLAVHQGTLSGFNFKTRRLFPIWGERDTYGGLRNPPWARNEWHGPGRGGVALEPGRIFWITGSRLLCVGVGGDGKTGKEWPDASENVSARVAAKPALWTTTEMHRELNTVLTSVVSRRWAPLYVEPGLAGRDFSFDQSAAAFEALSWAFPILSVEQQEIAKRFLAREWVDHPPFSSNAWYSLKDGARRENFWIPEEALARLGQDKPPHPFGNLYSVWLYAERCGEWEKVTRAWPEIESVATNFLALNWRLNPGFGDLYANRYLSGWIALERIADKAGQKDWVERARKETETVAGSLVEWWKNAAAAGTLRDFKGSGELDPFINSGKGLSFKVAPHRHKLALFADLTPEIAERLRAAAPEAVEKIWQTFQTLYRTWPLVGEERQVHYGENFIDPPDLALAGFRGLLWLKRADPAELAQSVDLPFCRADLYYAMKLALAINARGALPGENRIKPPE